MGIDVRRVADVTPTKEAAFISARSSGPCHKRSRKQKEMEIEMFKKITMVVIASAMLTTTAWAGAGMSGMGMSTSARTGGKDGHHAADRPAPMKMMLSDAELSACAMGAMAHGPQAGSIDGFNDRRLRAAMPCAIPQGAAAPRSNYSKN